MSTGQTASGQHFLSPQLADLIEGYREEVVASWSQGLYGMHASHYRERPITELQVTENACLSALIDLFRGGSLEPLMAYSESICRQRVEQGFDISELIEGHLLISEAMIPILQRELQWDSFDSRALPVARKLEAALRWLVIRFSRLYSLALNSQLKEQVHLLDEQRQQLERRVREVTALVRSSALINSTLNLDDVLTLILDQLAEVVQFDRASIQLLIEGRLRIIAGRGFARPDEVLGTTFDPALNALAQRLLSGGQPIVLHDVQQEPGFVADPYDLTRSWVGVPLIAREEVIGALTLDKQESSFYDDEAGQTVLAFANQAAVAIENARLYDRAREQDILAERNRLARELHDSLSQALFAMVLNAEAANLFFDTAPEKARSQINLLYETANAALRDMRTLIFELRPANLEQEGLAVVLGKHVRMIGERYGLKARIEIRGQRRLPSQIERALYRVAQEAINNVIKHARATEVTVSLNTQDSWAHLTVEDNGVGIETGLPRPDTLGMTSMRERVDQLGGVFEVGPGMSGVGTMVRVKVPCDK